MELDGQRRSTNIEDRRGRGGGGAAIGGLGVGGVIIVGLLLTFFPQARPLVEAFLGQQTEQTQPAPGPTGAPGDATGDFAAAVLGSIEDVWTAQFAQGRMQSLGLTGPYQPATLVLFDGSVQSACGFAQAAVGPFYCPSDSKVYLDLSFFQVMEQRLGAGGDFAQGYVIAHEVGHHIQNLAGISARTFEARQRASTSEANAISVRVELQADCLAGVWGHFSGQLGQLSQGDLEEALNAASAIGDDKLQMQSKGYVAPDSFTHGSSEQRMRWFKRGFDSGDPAQCDAINATQL